MNTKRKEGAGNRGNPYFLRVPWNKRFSEYEPRSYQRRHRGDQRLPRIGFLEIQVMSFFLKEAN